MDDTGLVQYRHPTMGFGLLVPSEWERFEDSQPGVGLIAVEPDHGLGFRANVVITVERLPDGFDLERWQAASEELLSQQLPDYMLLDTEIEESRGRTFFRRLAHHRQGQSGAVTMEQWALVDGGRGCTLTASAGTFAYDDMADTFAEMADGLRVDHTYGNGGAS